MLLWGELMEDFGAVLGSFNLVWWIDPVCHHVLLLLQYHKIAGVYLCRRPLFTLRFVLARQEAKQL